MTNEEAIKQLKKCKSFHNGSYGTAFDLAIKALEQISHLTVEFPTYDEMAKKIAEKALDEYMINDKPLRDWIRIIAEQQPNRCDSCTYSEEQDGSNCYECVKGMTDNFEAQPTDTDCISREAVIDHICESKDCYKEDCKGKTFKRCLDLQWVYELPSVTPSYNSIKTELKPCGDCISRTELLSRIDAEREHLLEIKMDGAEHIIVHHARRIIEDMPSVTPQQNVGKWIVDYRIWKCSNCDASFDTWRHEIVYNKYCPNCGAKMEEVEEV